MIDKILLKDIIKYLIIIGILYTILKLLPSQKLTNKDIMLLLFIIMIIFITIDYKCFKNNIELFSDTKLGDKITNEITTKVKEITTDPVPEITTPLTTTAPESNSLKELVQILSNIQSKETPTLPTTGCSIEVDKIKLDMQTQIDDLKKQIQSNGNTNYFDLLISDLSSSKIINDDDIQNIKKKIKLNLLTTDEVIKSLETLKQTTSVIKNNTDFKYNELATGFFEPIGNKIANEWDNDYTLLNTTKWTVPMSRPPVCINSTPCKVCPLDSSNIVSLKDWDNSRTISNTQMNKEWVNNTTI